LEFHGGFRKLESYGVVNVILDLIVFVQLRLVADRRTDRQTDTRWQLIPC